MLIHIFRWKRVLEVGTSDECATGRIADGMFGYLLICLLFALNPSDECANGRIADGMFGYLLICLLFALNPTAFTIQN